MGTCPLGEVLRHSFSTPPPPSTKESSANWSLQQFWKQSMKTSSAWQIHLRPVNEIPASTRFDYQPLQTVLLFTCVLHLFRWSPAFPNQETEPRRTDHVTPQLTTPDFIFIEWHHTVTVTVAEATSQNPGRSARDGEQERSRSITLRSSGG